VERSELGGRRQLGLATARMQKKEGGWMEGSEDKGWEGITCGASCDYSPPFFDQGSYAAATMAVEVLLEDGKVDFVACRMSARLFAGAY